MDYFAADGMTLTVPEKDMAAEIILTMSSEEGEISEARARVVGYLPKCQTRVVELSLLNGRHIGFAPGIVLKKGEDPKSPQYRERCKLIKREMKRWVRRNGSDFTTSPQTKH